MLVTACFSQMGGLRGLLPLLEDAPELSLRWHAREPALGYLKARGYAARHPGELTLDPAEGGVLLTDTINLSRTDEGLLCRAAWQAAARANVPSVAFMECWWGYLERFTLPGEALADAVLPDIIAVVDDIARAELLACGLPPQRVRVPGSPWLDALAQGRDAGRAETAGLRQRFGLGAGELVLAFVSQPLARVLHDRDSWGFTERDVVTALVAACAALPKDTLGRLRLVCLAHPEEDAAGLEALVRAAAPSFPAEVRKPADPLDLVRACDAVAGMNSMLLAEAALSGLPVLSIQPGLRREEILVTNRTGATLRVTDADLLPGLLARLLCDEGFRAELVQRQAAFPVLSGAKERWRELLTELAGGGRMQ
jgi:hypothetical protein